MARISQRGLWPQPNGNQGQRVEESKRRKEGVRVEIATFGLFDFSTPTLHSSKNLRRKQNFEAFVIRIKKNDDEEPRKAGIRDSVAVERRKFQ